MLHHAALHWPETADPRLWSLAVLYAMFILNHLPKEDTGRSPLELFGCKSLPKSQFRDYHVWGCPVYVLDSTLADGKKLPRWKSRSARGMFIGISQRHGSMAPLVLNLETGKISPAFHVVFDNEFNLLRQAHGGL